MTETTKGQAVLEHTVTLVRYRHPFMDVRAEITFVSGSISVMNFTVLTRRELHVYFNDLCTVREMLKLLLRFLACNGSQWIRLVRFAAPKHERRGALRNSTHHTNNRDGHSPTCLVSSIIDTPIEHFASLDKRCRATSFAR